MTVSSQTNKHYYDGTGSQTSFQYAFKIFNKSDLTVYVDNILKTVDIDYTVSNVGDVNGGNVVFTTAPASGTGNVAILRKLPLSQLLDLIQYGQFNAELIEESFDRLVYIAQQLQEASDRTIRFAATVSDGNPQEITDTATDRAGKVLAYDDNGDLTVAQELGEWKGDWATATQYYVRDLIKNPADDNVYIALTNHVSAAAIATDIGTNLALVVDAAAAATSASNAATSETNAASSATAAAASATAAAASESAAGTSETNAAGSATAAAASATAAAGSATTAGTKATEASTSASNAASSASSASTSATSASNAANAAGTSETNASNSATAAANSATAAAGSATTATTKAGEAATSATNAGTSETNAATSATAASNSATSAATSATAAAGSATAAAASAANAAQSYDSFDDRYLGAKSVEPTVNNDGDPLIVGNLYFLTGTGMKVWDGANWIDASAASNVSMYVYEYTATAGQTTFSGSDDNGQTLSYTASNIIVTYGGMDLDSDDYTATNGTSVVLADGAEAGKIVRVIAFTTFQVADTYTQAQADAAFKPITAAGKNLILNGDFQVWQRGTSFTPNTVGGYTADRWLAGAGASGNMAVSRQAFTAGQTDVPDNPKYYARMSMTNTPSDPTFQTRIEGVENLAGQTATLSFWVKADSAKTFAEGGYIEQHFGSGGSASVYTNIGSWSATTNWTKVIKTISVPSISGKTIGDGNFISVRFDTNNGENVVLDIANVQLELGSTATDFEHRSYGEELALCQRYYYTNKDASEGYFRSGYVGSSATGNRESLMLPVTMRAIPTIATVNTYALLNITSLFLRAIDKHHVHMEPTLTTSGTHFRYGVTFTCDAEL